ASHAEGQLRTWAAQPHLYQEVLKALSQDAEPEVKEGLREWEPYFRVNTRPDIAPLLAKVARFFGRPTTDALAEKWQRAEDSLARAKKHFKGTWTDGTTVNEASPSDLRQFVKTDPRPEVRASALESLRAYERYVLENGLIPILKARNEYARR